MMCIEDVRKEKCKIKERYGCLLCDDNATCSESEK